jgi:iron complex outermembrane receptor protein
MVKAGIIANYHDWSGSLDLNYIDKQYSQSDNSDVVSGVPGSRGAYNVLNTKLGYRFNDMIKLNASVTNLTNEKYYQFYLMPGINVTTELVLSF